MSLSKRFILCLVLVQCRKTHADMTERLLMGRKESSQTNKQSSPEALQRVLEQRLYPVLSTGSTQEDPSPHD